VNYFFQVHFKMKSPYNSSLCVCVCVCVFSYPSQDAQHRLKALL